MFGTVIGFTQKPLHVGGDSYLFVDVRLDNDEIEDYLFLDFKGDDAGDLRVGDRMTVLLSEHAFAVECYRGEVVRRRPLVYDTYRPKPVLEERINWRKEGW